MDIKISPAEKFVIRYSRLIRIVLLIALLFIIYAVFSHLNVPEIIILIVYLVLGTLLALLVELFALRRTRKLTEYLMNSLDLEGTLLAADSLLEIYKPNQLAYIGAVKHLKSVALCDEGRTTEAKKLATEFIDSAMGVKRPPYFQMFQMHSLLSTIALRERDFNEYRRQLDNAKACYKRCPGTQRKLIEKNKMLSTLRSNHKIFSSEQYSERFEKSLSASLERTPDGKPRKTEPDKMTKLIAYVNLFHYFETLGMDDRCREYANKILELANEQFDVYHQAKQYLNLSDGEAAAVKSAEEENGANEAEAADGAEEIIPEEENEKDEESYADENN